MRSEQGRPTMSFEVSRDRFIACTFTQGRSIIAYSVVDRKKIYIFILPFMEFYLLYYRWNITVLACFGYLLLIWTL